MEDKTHKQFDKAFMDCLANHIVFDGWMEQALLAAVEECNLPIGEVTAQFETYPDDLLILFAEQIENQLVKEVAALRDQPMRFHEKVIESYMQCFLAFKGHRQAWVRAKGLLIYPRYQRLALQLIANQVDQLWRAFGDKSLDFNFYSKRLLLGSAIIPTLTVYLEDESEELDETRAFLTRRIQAILKIPSFMASLSERVEPIKTKLRQAALFTPFCRLGNGQKTSLRMRGD